MKKKRPRSYVKIQGKYSAAIGGSGGSGGGGGILLNIR